MNKHIAHSRKKKNHKQNPVMLKLRNPTTKEKKGVLKKELNNKTAISKEGAMLSTTNQLSLKKELCYPKEVCYEV